MPALRLAQYQAPQSATARDEALFQSPCENASDTFGGELRSYSVGRGRLVLEVVSQLIFLGVVFFIAGLGLTARNFRDRRRVGVLPAKLRSSEFLFLVVA